MKINRLRISVLSMVLLLLTYQSFGQLNYFAGLKAGIHVFSSTSNNTFVGPLAGIEISNSYSNTFIGAYAGYTSTSGNENTFVGNGAGEKNKGNLGVFLGFMAGSENVGNNNAFIGSYAGYENTTGHANSFLGTKAGYANTTGILNTFLGYYAGYGNTTGQANNFLGFFAGSANSRGEQNNFFGTAAGSKNKTGSENVFLGRSAGEDNVDGSFNVSLGSLSGPSQANLNNATAIGYRASVNASNSLVLGSISGVNGATASTNVGIGTTTPGYLLHVNGTAAKPGGGSWSAASDQRLKKDIRAFTDGLELVRKIKPIWFRYNGLAGLPKNRQFVGIIAQEMQKIAPYTIGRFTHQDSTGQQTDYLDYDAGALPYMLVNAIREMDDKYTRLMAEKEIAIKSLESRISTLEQLIAQSPGAVSSEIGAAQLSQNEPNPTGAATLIRYRIPNTAETAQLKIFNLNGQQLQQFDIHDKGAGQQTIDTRLWPSGVYVYHLVVNGAPVAVKKLVIAK